MFRVLNEALRRTGPLLNLKNCLNLAVSKTPSKVLVAKRNFSSIISQNSRIDATVRPGSLLSNPKLQQISNNIISRSVTKFSWKKGKRKSVKTVIYRFYRLNWGGWIRTKCGRNKKLFKKSPARKRRLRQHVFCNGQQSFLLDKMVGPYWRKPRYYVDDPYEPYHIREEHRDTAAKPRPYFPRE